ncbi:MAG TPA: DUF3570 domain-containing protein [Flavitalea sp.]|nr:DUF3570 domain-containing protein [Flavitalea sp.]
MRILSLSMIGMYLGILSAFSQPVQDSAKYKSKNLQLEEIDLVSGYYRQDGNNSAVTGGIGTEKLTDLTNTIEVKLFKYDRHQRKNQFNFELGIDHYTSASSDNINPKTISSASIDDTRVYPSLSWSRENQKKGTSFGLTTSYSHEADYISYGAAFNFSMTSRDKKREFSLGLQAFFDTWKIIYPEELRPPDYGTGAKNDTRSLEESPRNSFTASFSYTQVINKKLQVALLADPTYQHGLLSTSFHRVYFNDGSLRTENLPGNKFKLPLGVRSNYFPGDQVIIRTLYRFYIDDWGMKAHTIDIETPVKLSSFISVSPFYRFHTQSAVDYFAPFLKNEPTQIYYSSDHDLSELNSHFYGLGVRISPPKGIFRLRSWNMLEIRYGHYDRSTDLHSDIISMHLKFK